MTERIRLLSEDVPYFRDVERTIARFTAETGIEVEIGFRFLTDLWTETERAYTEEPAPWDVVVTDEMILAIFVARGRVRALDDLVARDRYDASDYIAASLDLARFEGSLYGIPYANMCNVLGYRRRVRRPGSPGGPEETGEVAGTPSQRDTEAAVAAGAAGAAGAGGAAGAAAPAAPRGAGCRTSPTS